MWTGTGAFHDSGIMRNRVEQPPIRPFSRDAERHEFWPGFIVALIGAAVLVCGARHLTDVETLTGGSAWETQLIKAFSSGGLQYGTTAPPPRPGDLNDPTIFRPPSTASERLVASTGRSKVRINTAAKNPCPT